MDSMPDDLIARARIALQTECVDGAEWRAIVSGLIAGNVRLTQALTEISTIATADTTAERYIQHVISSALRSAASAPAERKERTTNGGSHER